MKTADGVEIIEGMTVYFGDTRGVVRWISPKNEGCEPAIVVRTFDEWEIRSNTQLYSSELAAQRASVEWYRRALAREEAMLGKAERDALESASK